MVKTVLKHYRSVQTEDGSLTLFSEAYQEACHSPSGAKTETSLHYIQGCKVLEKASLKKSLTILEVGFGTGLGFLMTYNSLNNFGFPILFISLEIDQNLVDWFFSQESNAAFTIDRKTCSDHVLIEGSIGNFSFCIVIGNARIALPSYILNHSVKWDAIYQDAFSPKKNPALWTQEWFKTLKDSSADDVILSTYSASNSIRKSMVAAGWKLYRGDSFGAKRTSTRASLSGETDQEISQQLSFSPAKALIDADLPRELLT